MIACGIWWRNWNKLRKMYTKRINHKVNSKEWYSLNQMPLETVKYAKTKWRTRIMNKFIDHFHFSGQFLECAQNPCNLTRRTLKLLPVVEKIYSITNCVSLPHNYTKLGRQWDWGFIDSRRNVHQKENFIRRNSELISRQERVYETKQRKPENCWLKSVYFTITAKAVSCLSDDQFQ